MKGMNVLISLGKNKTSSVINISHRVTEDTEINLNINFLDFHCVSACAQRLRVHARVQGMRSVVKIFP